MEIISPSVAGCGRAFLTFARDGPGFASNTSLNSIGANILTESPPRGIYGQIQPNYGPQFALTYNNSSTKIVDNDERNEVK